MAAIAAHPVGVYVAAADEHDADDVLLGLKDFTVKDSTTILDVTDMADSTGYKKRLAGLVDASVSLSGDYSPGDVPQGLLGAVGGSLVYVTILPDGTNGYSYPMLVESYEMKGEVDGIISMSVSLVGNGARVAKS